MRALGYDRAEYVRAEKAVGAREVWLIVRADEGEVTGPRSRTSSDIDDFKKRFQELHSAAFELLPPNVEVVLQLQHWPDANTFLTLYL